MCKTSRFDGTNYPGTICMADEKTVIVCNRGANTLSAFSTDGKLRYLGEWATGSWPRHLLQIPGTDLIVNACNKEGALIIFAWNGKELIRKDEIILPGASCAVLFIRKVRERRSLLQISRRNASRISRAPESQSTVK